MEASEDLSQDTMDGTNSVALCAGIKPLAAIETDHASLSSTFWLQETNTAFPRTEVGSLLPQIAEQSRGPPSARIRRKSDRWIATWLMLPSSRTSTAFQCPSICRMT